jgi:hypothetical protein
LKKNWKLPNNVLVVVVVVEEDLGVVEEDLGVVVEVSVDAEVSGVVVSIPINCTTY